MSKSIPKTNAMRILEREKIPYQMHTYDPDGEIDGISVAGKIDVDQNRVFKTLVTKGKSGSFYVFVIPVAAELDLKAAAAAVAEKSVEMLHVKDLERTTGYIRGGCSPIGMKKKYPTYIDETYVLFDEIAVSAGMRGEQIIIDPNDLVKYVEAKVY